MCSYNLMTSTYVHTHTALHASSNRADQELDEFDSKIRCGEDNLSQTAGPRLQGCGREMHTTGSIDYLKNFKFAATSFMNTYFEQIIERDLAGQDAFLVLIWHMPDTGAERAV